MSFRTIVVFVCLGVGALSGCGEEPSEGAEQGNTMASERRACVGDFEATVRSGPSAGAMVYGGFAMEELEDGSLSTTIMTQDGEILPVATLSEEGLELQIEMPNGTIVGLDPSMTDMQSCPSVIEGDLVGPAEGDAGDWLARTTTVTSNGNTYTSTFDANGVVIQIEITNQNGDVTILVRCNNGFQAGGC